MAGQPGYWPVHTGKLVLAQFLLLPEASPAAQEGGGAGQPPRHVCAPPGGSFLMKGGTDCSPLPFTVGRAKWRVHLSHSGAVCLIKEFIGRVISPGSGPSRVTL